MSTENGPLSAWKRAVCRAIYSTEQVPSLHPRPRQNPRPPSPVPTVWTRPNPPPALATSSRCSGNTPPVLARTTAKERKEKLGRILTYLDDAGNKQRLIEALQQDLHKPEVESLLSEIGVLYNHVRYVQGHLREWMEPKRVSTPLSMLGTMNYIYYEPKGCVLILSPWNYPFNLAIVPLIYAVAAGVYGGAEAFGGESGHDGVPATDAGGDLR